MFSPNDYRRVVLIVCPNPKGFHPIGPAAGAHIRYLLINEEIWFDDPTWGQFRRLTAKYPWIETLVVFAKCPTCTPRLAVMA